MKNRDELAGKVHPALTPQKYPGGEMTGEVDYTEGADLTDLHAAIAREHPEPVLSTRAEESVQTFPMWLMIVCGLALFWAGGYLFLFSGAFRSDVFDERRWEPGMFFASEGTGGGGAEKAAEKTPVELGEIYYKQNCATCHQPTGQGAEGMYPPLVQSEWVTGSEKRLAGIVLDGLAGPITVHGEKKAYSGVMQAWGPTLPDVKIAAILTYIRQAWGNTAGPISPEQMAAARKEFSGRSKPWTEEDLLQIPADATLPGGGAEAAPATAPAGS